MGSRLIRGHLKCCIDVLAVYPRDSCLTLKYYLVDSYCLQVEKENNWSISSIYKNMKYKKFKVT